MSKTKIFIIIIGIALGVVGAVLLLTRSEARAQERGVAEQLIDAVRENLEPFGIGFDFEFVGVVENVDEFAAQLTATEEAFFRIEKGQLITETMGALMAEAGNEDAQESIKSEMREGISDGDYIYRVYFEGASSRLTISPDGSTYSGAVARLSRLNVASFHQPPNPQAEESNTCAIKVLTRNIFGQPAEQIEVCVRAYCTPPAVDGCEILTIEPRSWWFGRVFVDPESTPVDGTVYRYYCRGPVKYKWGVGLGAIRTSKYGDFEVENLRMGGQGTVMPEISCQL